MLKMLLLFSSLSFAASFEVASITPCKPGTAAPAMEHTGLNAFASPGGRFNATATSLKALIEWAYGIQPQQHSGGPGWMDTDRYDVAAKAEGNATEDEMKLMMQTLLTERFQLKFHHETKDLTVYTISVGKTAPKLTPSTADQVRSIRFEQQARGNRVSFTRFSIAQLNDTFARQLGRMVVDKTGLAGEFDFSVVLVPDESRPNPVDPDTLMSALREQIGLTLKSEKAPVDVWVIDSVQKVVAGN